jgi:hypothetical protein
MKSLLFFLAAVFVASPLSAADAGVRAIIENRCLSCHGQAQMSGLDLRQLETILKGGKRGAAIQPGNAAGSLLYKAVAGEGELRMPPGKPLPAAEVALIRSWIDGGARWEKTAASESTWWAFRPVVKPAVPSADPAWEKNPIDSFVLRTLRQKGLTPAAPAEKRVLVRRAYLDLHGIPPTPQETAEFLDDSSPDAYEKLVDRLLASPRYGERFGRHWLDVVRYADTGGFETDMYYANAWRYRDYVIKSFNDDKPYDRFVQEQVAGDELWPGDLALEGTLEVPEPRLRELEARIGTGLYTVGPTYHEAALNGEQLRYEWLTDAVDTTAQAFLGLTIGCARCHDHKFDPISQRDYHRMMALFAGSEERNVSIVSKMNEFGYKAGYPGVLLVDEYKAAVERIDAKARKRTVDAIKAKFPREIVEAFDTPAGKRTPQQMEQATAITAEFIKVGLEENASGVVYVPEYTPEEHGERERLLRELGLAALKGRMEPQTATILGHSDVIPEVRMTVRGDFHGTGDRVGPGFPVALGGAGDLVEPAERPFVPQRRKALALWLTRPGHPLTARVMVNRLWAWHFGRGLVGTPGDFGRQGEAPSHPELLDWLASEFVSQGWSIKKMHRLILLSNTYRMSGQANPANANIDAANRYLWRMNRRRLDAEQLRDSVLAVACTLNLKMGGRPVIPPLTAEEKTGLWAQSQWPASLNADEHRRRSVYLYAKRSFPYPMFTIFDVPDSSVSCPQRDSTTVAPQALALFNSSFVLDQARSLAKRLEKEHPEETGRQIDLLWKLVLGRSPAPSEAEQGLNFLKTNAETGGGNHRAAPLEELCVVMLNTNEFLYID